LKLLIYEFASGGGFAEKPIPSSILSEGFAMLRTITEDAKAAGHKVTSILDSRIAEFNPPLENENILLVDSWQETENAIQETTEKTDAAYVIAPETDGILKMLVEKIENSKTMSLNSNSKAIAKVSNKNRLQKHAKKIGLPTPETLTFGITDDQEKVIQEVEKKIGFPAVFKPVNNVGCGELSCVNSKALCAMAIAKIANQSNSRFITQELIQGQPASVTIISDGTKAVPISLNKQKVSLRTPKQDSTYNGGTTPFVHPQNNKAFATAKRLVESIEGLRGYVGVDLILTKKEPFVIEINPRLTTSYIGIRKILNINLAQILIDSTLKHKLPTKQKTLGYAVFSKIKIKNPTTKSLDETFEMPELVAPPFPNLHGNMTYALICAQAKTLQQAKRTLSNAKKQLYNTINKGGKRER
jgi:predicted ATP-grasp superfamily ATP-dependent carboligase